MSIKELRSKISIVPQFGFLFNASVRENLNPDLSMSEQDLLAIFEKHELSIRNLSGKELLDFTIDQGGENLSNGEKQIINCVRVLLQSRDIICLDEATSNMDPKTDKVQLPFILENS
jgi:ATP-binding cassette subfamily C (CFTR/MRP) protein 1